MTQRPLKLTNFLEEFLNEHAAEGDQIVLELSDQEIQDLGLFFIKGFCGYVLRKSQAAEVRAETLQ